ncbi:hypothetical protein ZIOFF_059182 [Zingiber officinale]|uniref:RNA helicase n=1 Tax=Zingiber officinale TaxID=94328 RepID=A0A8J5KB68_ZINOF|nr:hypothetical protein ZIOFF_059182 [Zingiber officinale]
MLKKSRKTGYGRSPSVLIYDRAVGLSPCSLYGGSPFHAQVMSIRARVDIVVGTLGRVKDHIQRNSLDLKTSNFRMLDKVDEMLKMSFIDDMELILPHIHVISARFLNKDKETADLVSNQKLKARHRLQDLGLAGVWFWL